MAKLRVVNTRFWDDDFTANLDPIEKLLFLYLLTNTSTDICGVYEIPLKKMAMDTGIEKGMLEVILKRFEDEGKVIYEGGWVGIKNFIKNQSVNPKVLAGIKIGLVKAPKSLTSRLGIDVDSLSHSNSNLNTNSNTNSKEIVDVIDGFKFVNQSYSKWFGNKTQRASVERLLKIHGLERILEVLLVIPKTNSMPYIPTITTPVQLEDKWAQLESSLKKKKQELTDKKPKVL